MIKCRAIVAIGDDYGDNSCTFHCQLDAGHEGLHSENFENSGKNLTLTWDGAEKVEVQRYKFKITRTLVTYQTLPAKEYETETIFTDLVSYSELFDKYGTFDRGSEYMGWRIDEVEEIEGSLEVELVYADELKD